MARLVAVDNPNLKPLPPAQTSVGLDLGINTVAVCGANVRPDQHELKGQLRKTSNGESSPEGGFPAIGN